MSQIGARLVGTLLDNRYLVGSPIARGGMSTVYSGTDVRLGRGVAIKVMNSEFSADPKFLSRFEFEARSVAGLKDPGLVAVYDQGVDGEYAFLVMELVRGGTLRELLRERGPMPPHAAAAVARPALTALAAAHRAGLVHRDVKPENVLISDDGDVKLADFGLVRAVAGSNATSSSVILGTAAYLSPEQVSTGHADPRSDVYAVGILVFEMLTGRTPFPADTPLAVAYRRIHEDVPAPSTLISGVPPELDAFVLRATDRDAAARFVDAADMGQALDRLAAQLHLPAFRVPAPTQSAQHRAAHAPPARPAVDAAAATVVGEAATQHIPGTAIPGHLPLEPAEGAHATRHYTTESARAEGHYPPEHAVDGDQDLGLGLEPRDTGRPDSDTSGFEAPPAFTAEVARQRRRSRRAMALWLVAILALAATLGVGGWWFGSGRYATVPATAGMDQASAIAALEAAGLSAEVAGVYSDTEPADSLLGLRPGEGTRVLRSSAVVVSVSLGKPTVPELKGLAAADAVLATLAERTLVASLGPEEYSTTVPKGSVLRLTPGPGSVVPVGSKVTVVKSKGKPPVQVPDLAGKSQEDATAALAAAGLKVDGVRTAFDADTDGGRVFGADPSVGNMVSDGSKVTLLVSNAIAVPDLAGKSPDKAHELLTAAGLVPVDAGTTADGDQKVGTIGKTEPAQGGRVDPSHPEVKLYVSNAVKIPSLLGQSVSSARAKLTALGLTVEVKQLVGNDRSLVINQSPSGGSKVEPGKRVTLTALP